MGLHALFVKASPRATLTFVLTALLLGATFYRTAYANSTEYDFDIARQPLTPALEQFGQQARVQYLYLPASAEEERTLVGPVTGRFTLEELLRRLLPTGFTFHRFNERTVVISSPPVVTQPSLPEWSGLRMTPRAGRDGQGILVIASRIWLDGLLQPPTELFEFERRNIERLGVSTVPELLRYLTQQPFARSDLSNSGDQRVELRGLGRDTTLVLLNGRRVGASSASFDIDAFDLHTIPLPAVERIEIIQDFLPFAVGADAIGGVFNIVLRNDVAKPLLEVSYGAAEGGGEERRVSGAIGTSAGRGRVSAVLDHFERAALLGATRDRWRNQDYRRFESVDYRSLASNPGNVQSLTLDNLPGLPSRSAAVPRHESGQRLKIEDFLATAGQQNFESLRRYRSVVPERERTSIIASADVSVSPSTRLFGEAFYTRGTTIQQDWPFTFANVMVPASNAFNPFGRAVAVSFLPSSLDARTWTTDGEFARAVAGLEGQWKRWNWELSLQRTRDANQVTQENEFDPMRLADALAHSDPDRALNVLDDGPGGSAALIQSLIAQPIVRDYASKGVQATVRAHGEVADLPAGALSLSWGGEWRESSMSIDTRLPESPRRTVRSTFLQIRLPVVDPDMSLGGIHQLAVAAAGRLDEYSDIGQIANSQFGVTWNPIKPLVVRATFGTSFRAPSIFELYMPAIRLPFALPDLRRGNEIAQVLVTVGGNPALQATTARSWSAGMSFEPESLSHLTFAATYWRAHLDERITPIALPTLTTHDELFPDRVTRAPPSAVDIAAGRPGRLLGLDVRPGNVGRLTASGLDLSASIDTDTRVGRFSSTLSVTWMDEFSVRTAPGFATVDSVGTANVLGTITRWRAVPAITWSKEGLSMTTTARFVSSYNDFNSVMNRENGRKIERQTFLDAQAALQLDPYVDVNSAWRGLRISAGITNLLNDHPPFAELGADIGYDFTQGDLKGRFGYITLVKRF